MVLLLVLETGNGGLVHIRPPDVALIDYNLTGNGAHGTFSAMLLAVDRSSSPLAPKNARDRQKHHTYSRLPEIVNTSVRRPPFTILRLFTITDGPQTQAGQLLALQ